MYEQRALAVMAGAFFLPRAGPRVGIAGMLVNWVLQSEGKGEVNVSFGQNGSGIKIAETGTEFHELGTEITYTGTEICKNGIAFFLI